MIRSRNKKTTVKMLQWLKRNNHSYTISKSIILIHDNTPMLRKYLKKCMKDYSYRRDMLIYSYDELNRNLIDGTDREWNDKKYEHWYNEKTIMNKEFFDEKDRERNFRLNDVKMKKARDLKTKKTKDIENEKREKKYSDNIDERHKHEVKLMMKSNKEIEDYWINELRTINERNADQEDRMMEAHKKTIDDIYERNKNTIKNLKEFYEKRM